MLAIVVVVEELNVGKLRTIVQDAIGRMRGHSFGWKEGSLGFEPRLVILKVRLGRGEI